MSAASVPQTERRVVLATPRARVTTWLEEDLGDLRALQSDPEVVRHLLRRAETPEETWTRLARYLTDQDERGWTRWRVEDEDGAMIGRAGYELGADGAHRELGYAYRRDTWGRGIATEVGLALVTWHDDHPEPRVSARLDAYAIDENHASRRVLDKLGFIHRGRRRHRGEDLLFYTRG